MSVLRELNAELASVQGALNFETLLTDVVEAQQRLVASSVTKMGTQINQVLGGFTSITQEVEGPISQLSDAIPGGIALLTENPPGLDIKKAVPQLNNSIQALTEDTTDGGFLNLEVTLGTPKAVATALARVTNKPATAVRAAVNEVAPNIAGVTDKIESILGDIQKQTSVVTTLRGSFEQFASKLSNQIKGDLLNKLNNLPELLSADLDPLRAQVRNIQSGSEIDPISRDTTFVSSVVEVQAILSSAQREITEIVIGTTQTFKDADVRAGDAPGWHFIITRDGELQQGLNIDKVGEYAENHNINTIGLAFAGGLGVMRREARGGDRAIYASPASISREQWNTFDKFMQQFYAVYPYGQALGVSDIMRSKESSPGFDVIDYVKQRFNKVTVVDTSKPAPSLKELQAQIASAKQRVIDPQINDEPGEG